MKPGTFVTLTIIAVPLLALQGCSHSRTQGVIDLENGVCPASIIDSGGQPSQNTRRYGRGVSHADLTHYRDRELANCERQVASGDVQALRVLVDYWHERKNPAQVARAYRSYLDKGSDSGVLAEASVHLYRAYYNGDRGVPADQTAALYYLGLAVDHGRTDLTLAYADALHDNQRYRDAFNNYYRLATNAGGTSRYYSREQMCEINFRLANLYFTGSGTQENWYLGYYFWQRAAAIADGPEWGSCARDNFLFGERYAMESQRKRTADSRIKAMSSREIGMLRENVRKPNGKGLEYLASLDFTPRSAGSFGSRSQQAKGAGRPAGGVWQHWTPLNSEICRMQASHKPLPWSDIFEMRANAVWTLSSATGSKASRGSAVAVAPRQLITNCHLIQSPHDITLQQANRRTRGQVIAADVEGDRCVVQVGEKLPGYVTSARRHALVRVGEDVSAIGNPRGLDSSLSRGIVAQKRMKNGRAYLQTDTAISSGSSGGGLFDSAGNLVGITTFTVASGENLNFAISIDEFCRE